MFINHQDFFSNIYCIQNKYMYVVWVWINKMGQNAKIFQLVQEQH